MIQEPQVSQQEFTQTTTTTSTQPQFHRQTIRPQASTQQHYYQRPKQLSTAADTVTVTELGTLTPNLTIPIAINSQVHQRIVLITTPKNRTPQQTPIQSQAPITRYIRVPFVPRSEPRATSAKTTPFLTRSAQKVPFLTRSAKRAPFLVSSENRAPFLTGSENRVPFLARSEPITLSVKKNSPQNVTVKTQRPITAVYRAQVATPTQYSQTVTNTDYQFTSSSAVCQQVPPTTPMTLATMAGIQLTGADESYADMSGAMPATVEEINVPVFIDEYLQQSTPTSTTTTAESAAATNINNNYNNSNSSNNGYGNDNCIEGDEDDDGTFEHFEFDIGMIEELEEQQQQQQMYLCNSNNTNNNSDTMSHNSSSNDNNSNCFNNNYYINSNNNNHNNNNTFKFEVKNEDDFKLEQQFLIAPNANCDIDILSEDTFGFPSDLSSFASEENAVDISHFTNDEPIFSNCMNSSQCNPMLGETISISTNNSQALFTNAEPMLSYDQEEEYEQFEANLGKLSQQTSCSQSQYAAMAVGGELCDIKMENLDVMVQGGAGVAINNIMGSGTLKRAAAVVENTTTSQTMAEKRRRLQNLRLNTSMRSMATEPEIRTPDVINLISEMSNDEHKMSSTQHEIFNELLNGSNSSFQSVTTEIYASMLDNSGVVNTNDTAYVFEGKCNTDCHDDDDDYDEDMLDVDESPCTPHSCTSSSAHTNHTSHDSPNSPALSIASTSASTSASNGRKKRGRPSKQHSDRPDPKQMRNLSENERKRLEDRAKNNEASRLSRLKNKQREEAEMEEEQHLNVANAKLHTEMNELDSTIEKLKRALKRMQFPSVTQFRAQ